MGYKSFDKKSKELIKQLYATDLPRKEVQETLAKSLGVSVRTIRYYANHMGLGLSKESLVSNPTGILVYDFETSRVPAKLWWPGKQYVGYKQIKGEPKIITVAYKWFGEDETYHLTWDRSHSDETLVRKFSEVFNSANMVVGHNIINFDNRWLRARALKYGITVDPYIPAFDTMKEAKALFRLQSYSLDYLTEYLDVTRKQSHEGIIMWDMVEEGTPEQQAEYLQKMLDYNEGDIISNEELFVKMRKYSKAHKVHLGTLEGGEKFACPHCGSSNNVELGREVSTAAGTIQKVMVCKNDGVRFKISNREYLKFMENQEIIY